MCDCYKLVDFWYFGKPENLQIVKRQTEVFVIHGTRVHTYTDNLQNRTNYSDFNWTHFLVGEVVGFDSFTS